MQRRDLADFAAGLVLSVAGLAIALHVLQTHDIGTLRRMGPGMVPMGLGFLLMTLGALLAVSGLLRRTVGVPRVQRRAFLFVLLAIAAFAGTIRLFGLVPAVVVLVLLSALADSGSRARAVGALVVILPFLAFLIFKVGLGMTMPAFRWVF